MRKMSWSDFPTWGDLPGWDDLPTWSQIFAQADAQIEYRIQLASLRASWEGFSLSDGSDAGERALRQEAMRRTQEKFR